MIVYITRHGQPLLQPADAADPEFPRHDPPLTPLGEAQAIALGRRLRALGFRGRIYTSPYRRTVRTAECIAAELNTVHYPEAAIREIVKRAEQMVGFQGLSLEALRAEFRRVAPDAALPYPWWTPQAEDDAAVLARVAPFLERLLERRDGDVLLVGHGASVGAATRFFLERCTPVPEEMPLSWNCALTAFRVQETCETLLIRDTAHLPDEEVTSNAKTKLEVEGTPVAAGQAVADEPDASVEGAG